MYSTNANPNSPIASNLPGAASMSAAIRRGKLEISGPIPDRLKDSRRVESTPTTTTTATDVETGTWPRRSTFPNLRKSIQIDHHHDRTAGPESLFKSSSRNSTLFANSQRPQSSLLMEGSARRPGLRAAVRRVFRSRSKKHFDTPVLSHEQSGPGAFTNDNTERLHRAPLQRPSLLFDEIIRGRGLNSHAPTALAPDQDHKPVRYAGDPKPTLDSSGRRNSLPTVVVPLRKSKRPFVTPSQYSQTSGSRSSSRPPLRMHRSFINSMKRRSRSADALRDVACSQNSLQAQERRLSEEIKYWRNSIILDPVPVLITSQTDVDRGAEVFKSPATSLPGRPIPDDQILDDTVPDAQPPWQGAPIGRCMVNDDDASAEQRITTVEVKLADLEYAIVNLQRHDLPQSFMNAKHPTERRALPPISARPLTPASQPELVPKSSFDSFSTDSSAREDDRDRFSEHRASIATTTTTFRPGAARHSDPFTMSQRTAGTDDLARLMSMLDQEREARRTLEAQLKDMQNQLDRLRFPSTPQPAPTPANKIIPTCNSVVHTIPFSTPKPHNTTTTLPFRKADLTPRSAPAPAPLALAAPLPIRATPGYTRYNNDDDDDDQRSTETDTDDSFLDVYETPTESSDFAFGFAVPPPTRNQALAVAAV